MLLVDEVLSRIGPNDRVLDVGGWACPFNRADWVLDCEPFETRGYYATIGLPPFQGGDIERFTRETWLQRDICDHTPWPFPDQFFDYAVCSHTLEDIRDPLFVCSELNRVAKRGYIETPSRLAETCRGWENEAVAGLSHHRWLIDYGDARLDFTAKYHMIHADRRHNLPPRLFASLSAREQVSCLFWEGSFAFEEHVIHGLENQSRFLREFVDEVAASERFQSLARQETPPFSRPSSPDPLAELAETRFRLDQAHHALAGYHDLGPIALGVARRLRRASIRFPRAAELVKSMVRPLRQRNN